MYLFECSFMKDFKYYERVHNTNTKRSEVREIKNQKTEYYVEDPKGIYKGFINGDKTYSLQFGSSKDAREQAGVCQPIYRNIRDNYSEQGSYNFNPRIWYLDIETRSGMQYKSTPDLTFFVRTPTGTEKMTIKEIQTKGISGEYSRDGKTWNDISKAPWSAKTSAFPIPVEANHEVTLIQIYDNIANTVFILGLKDIDVTELTKLGYVFDVPVKYINCETELKLLCAFARIFKRLDPLTVLAWNGNMFDFPYLYFRMKKFGLENELSNYGTVELKRVESDSPDFMKFDLLSNGHFFMDFMDIYKKFTFTPQSSYALDNIAEFELNKTKVKHSEFPTFDSFYTGDKYIYSSEEYDDILRELIRKAYKTDAEKFGHYVDLQFVLYGIYDVILLRGIDSKLKLTNLMSTIASIMGVQLNDTMRTVKPWSQYIANEAHKRMEVLPAYQERDNPHIVGGYVMQPKPGKYSWIMNCDVNSMYPRLSISAFNMSPETYVPLGDAPAELRDAVIMATKGEQDEELLLNLDEKQQKHLTGLLQKYNMSMGINGALFKKDKVGLVPELVSKIFFSRKKTKKIMLEYYELANQISQVIEEKQNG